MFTTLVEMGYGESAAKKALETSGFHIEKVGLYVLSYCYGI